MLDFIWDKKILGHRAVISQQKNLRRYDLSWDVAGKERDGTETTCEEQNRMVRKEKKEKRFNKSCISSSKTLRRAWNEKKKVGTTFVVPEF